MYKKKIKIAAPKKIDKIQKLKKKKNRNPLRESNRITKGNYGCDICKGLQKIK